MICIYTPVTSRHSGLHQTHLWGQLGSMNIHSLNGGLPIGSIWIMQTRAGQYTLFASCPSITTLGTIFIKQSWQRPELGQRKGDAEGLIGYGKPLPPGPSPHRLGLRNSFAPPDWDWLRDNCPIYAIYLNLVPLHGRVNGNKLGLFYWNICSQLQLVVQGKCPLHSSSVLRLRGSDFPSN